METPLISIIIPTLNRCDYLALTLESVLNQTHRPIEVIVVDDGSIGNANRELCNKYPEVSYVWIENSGGPAKPRNVGIEKANGDFLAFVDDDDIWLPEKLQKQIEVLNNHPGFGLVHGPCSVIDENGSLTSEIIGRSGDPMEKHGDVRMRMMGNWTLMMPTPLVRKELVLEVGRFNEEIPAALEDVEFWVRCSFYTKFYFLDDLLVRYRKHSNNISSNQVKYLKLPLYLNEVRKKMLVINRINTVESAALMKNLGRMQLKMMKRGRVKVLRNMFTLDPFWFLKLNNLKVLAKSLT
ncbi:glycosyltransferase [Aureitalea sp. L0-47]|uniref:glycosyltransferase family 2 protein n=1 Tax=Aureitalea sp. L0-47 TaxID=2816962 RepID=UPI002238E904|nr:glycosyltransferase [Aureitalea sp. L0-47]MCW5519177.1 glycosyltransferase [Aureitalea sp. L0-47]